ncbi:MAG TPA: helix-turn-helix domain-containing protein [Nitrososphaeraceae archaeon]
MKPDEIRALRKRNGLSQQSFAEVIGVSIHTIHSWEHGKCKPMPMALRKLRAYDFETKDRSQNER